VEQKVEPIDIFTNLSECDLKTVTIQQPSSALARGADKNKKIQS
jgi:hypothetical protein